MIVVAVIAMAEVVRALRLLNVAAGSRSAPWSSSRVPAIRYTAAIVVTGPCRCRAVPAIGAVVESYGDWDWFVG